MKLQKPVVCLMKLLDLARFCQNLENVRVGGLMCLPPYDDDAEKTRPYFRQLRDLRDSLMAQNLLCNESLEGDTFDGHVG